MGVPERGKGIGIHGSDSYVNGSGRRTYNKPAVIGCGIPKTPLAGTVKTNLTGMEGTPRNRLSRFIGNGRYGDTIQIPWR